MIKDFAMVIGGLQKLTLLDFPGKIACTVFLSGCNFRCPFCHNSALINGVCTVLSEEAFFSFLAARKGRLDGVCISGGEPCASSELVSFIQGIRALGFAVKLDTNGSYPDVLSGLLQDGLLDMVAMDFKNSPEKYALTAGIAEVPFEKILASKDLLAGSGFPYEFRTTVVNELHTAEDMEAIGKLLAGVDHYYLQAFRSSSGVVSKGLTAPSRSQMRDYLKIVKEYIPAAEIRGE